MHNFEFFYVTVKNGLISNYSIDLVSIKWGHQRLIQCGILRQLINSSIVRRCHSRIYLCQRSQTTTCSWSLLLRNWEVCVFTRRCNSENFFSVTFFKIDFCRSKIDLSRWCFSIVSFVSSFNFHAIILLLATFMMFTFHF